MIQNLFPFLLFFSPSSDNLAHKHTRKPGRARYATEEELWERLGAIERENKRITLLCGASPINMNGAAGAAEGGGEGVSGVGRGVAGEVLGVVDGLGEESRDWLNRGGEGECGEEMGRGDALGTTCGGVGGKLR